MSSSTARPAVLVFPPLWAYTSAPYLSTPSLAAYLRQQGIPSFVFDINTLSLSQLSDSKVLRAVGHSESVVDLDRTIISLARKLGAQHYLDGHKAALFVGGVASASTKLSDLIRLTHEEASYPFKSLVERVVKEEIAPLEPAVVGISIVSEAQVLYALRIVKSLRNNCGDSVKIIIGGAWCTLLAPILQIRPVLFDLVDAIAIGEGETPMLDFYTAVTQKQALDSVPSIMFAQGGRVQRTHHGPLVDMSGLPLPAFDLLDLPLYQKRGRKLRLPVQGSRGCYYGKCKFCNYVSLTDGYRIKAPQVVASDMRALRDLYDSDRLVLIDDIVAPGYLRKLAEALLANRVNVTWSAMTRAQKGMDRKLLKLLWESGCRKIFYGIESGSQRVLDRVAKGTTVEFTRGVVEETVAAGIVPAGGMILGLPGDQVEDIRATVEYARSLPIEPEDLSLQEFVLGRESEYWGQLDEIIVDKAYLQSVRQNDVLINMRFPQTSEVKEAIDEALSDHYSPQSIHSEPVRDMRQTEVAVRTR